MKDITSTLKGFSSLAEFRDFLNEQINDGAEISRGKDPNDKSKEEKANEEANADAEAPNPQADSSDVGAVGGEDPVATAPVIDPSTAPGSQVTIGNKEVEDTPDPKATPIDLSGEENKINMKPVATINPSNGINAK